MKKKIIVVGLIVLVALLIVGLYGTFAASSTMTGSDNIYTITLTGNTGEVVVPANSSKTIMYQITNTNKGTVQYGVAYKGDNSNIKIYGDSLDTVSGIIDYGENKFIKLYIENTGSTESTVSIKSILGYEYGGSLDVLLPSGYSWINYDYPGKLSEYITNLYTNADKTVVTNNSIEYNQAQSVSLMNDRLGGTTTDYDAGNIRYYGASPNNYIYFNCDNYDSQSSNTCEKWRIIGVFDDKVKIMKEDPLGVYTWDYTAEGEYNNNWNDATLNTLLNNAYYNSSSTTYYNGSTTGTLVSFSDDGITSATRDNNLISSSIWYPNAIYDSYIYANDSYSKERTVGQTWTGHIALIYDSDFGYATDLNNCQNKLFNYNSEECTSTNWISSILLTDGYYWTLTPASSSTHSIWGIFNSQIRSNDGVHYFGYVIPTLYLDENVLLKKGNGTEDNPYQIYKKEDVTLIEHITNLYEDNYDSLYDVTFADDTGMNYYAPSVSLMNDGLDRLGNMTNDPYTGNIRYYGASPNNYIYFNCSDYSNQSSSTCETWRIIGIVDGKVKILKEEEIGYYVYDYTSSGSYDNNWNDATLNTLLNNAYYNSSSMTYYNGSTTGTLVNYSEDGITSATKNNDLISLSTWYPNKILNDDIYSNNVYKNERTLGQTWTGNIALMYDSDYGYMTDLNSCKSVLSNYNEDECKSASWISSIMITNNYYWTMAPSSTCKYCVWGLYNNNVYYNSGVHDPGAILPVLYLDTKLIVNSNTNGSKSNPYQLIV